MTHPVSLAVVICTYNQAALLDRVLGTLARQHPAEAGWSVLVVDNNCTDETPDVVAAHAAAGRIPGLRRVCEPEQGLTPARRAGVLHTEADWIAFVDDDCLLADDWVERMIRFLRAHPEATAVGGRVLPAYEEPPPPYVSGFEWCFARQDHGPEPVVVGSLVGAGMVVRREALRASGWLERPLVADRVGRRLVSGGDVELALRLRAVGDALWYTPACTIRHVIPPHRTTRRYLLRMTLGLGASSTLGDALVWPESYASWSRTAGRRLKGEAGRTLRQLGRALAQRRGLTPALLDASFVAGARVGLGRFRRMDERQRAEILGRAVASQEPEHS